MHDSHGVIGMRPVAPNGPRITKASSPALPDFLPMDEPNFMWGTLSGSEFKQLIRETYDEVVHRRRNILLVPSGKVG